MRVFKSGSLITGALTVALALATAPSTGQAADLSLAKIKVAMPFTVLVQRAALEASMKAGYMKEEGLDVEFVRFRSWTEPVQAIAGDAAQFALGGGSTMRAVIGRKAPIRQIAAISSRYPYAFFVKKSSGIKSLKDLRGKTIQTVRRGETLDNVWVQMLSSVGLKMADVKRVESFNGFGTLASGNADIANLSSVFTGKARKAGFVKIVDYNEWRKQQGLDTGGANNLGWGTSLKMLKQHPDTVRAYLRALARATDRLRKDKAFGVSVLMDKPYALDRATAEEVYDLHRNHWVVRLDPAKGDHAFDAQMVEIVMKRPKGSIDLKTVADTGPVTAVLKELKLSF